MFKHQLIRSQNISQINLNIRSEHIPLRLVFHMFNNGRSFTG